MTVNLFTKEGDSGRNVNFSNEGFEVMQRVSGHHIQNVCLDFLPYPMGGNLCLDKFSFASIRS